MIRILRSTLLVTFKYTAQGSPGGSTVKSPPAKARDSGSVPGQEDSLEKEMATHSSILAWEIPWTEESRGLQSKQSQRVRNSLASKQQQLTIVAMLYILSPWLFVL